MENYRIDVTVRTACALATAARKRFYECDALAYGNDDTSRRYAAEADDCATAYFRHLGAAISYASR